MVSQSSRGKGIVGEDIACNYLKSRGFIVYKRNLYILGGEVDILAVSPLKVWWFIEVKYSPVGYNVNACENFTPRKQRLVKRSAAVLARKFNITNYQIGLVVVNNKLIRFFENVLEDY